MTATESSHSPGQFVERARLFLSLLFGFLICACAGLYGFAPQIVLPDMGWHLAQGEWMVRHLSFLRQDVFNYPVLNAPLISEYPFYQVATWLAWRFGEYGAATLCATLLILQYALYLRSGSRLRFPTGLLALSLLFSVILAIKRSNLRPELATTIGVVFFMVTLLRLRHETDWKKFIPLVIAQILWTNSHSGFILGPALVCGVAGEIILREGWQQRKLPLATIKVWGLASALVVAACFVNPYGPQRLLLPFYHQGSEVIRAYVTEMQALAFNLGDFFVMVMVLQFVLIALSCVLHRGGICWTFLLLTIFFFKETFISERHMSTFALMAPGVLLSTQVFGRRIDFSEKTRSILRSLQLLILLAATMGALLLVYGEVSTQSSLSPFARWRAWERHQTEMPITATAWMKQNHLTGRLIHRSEVGGWLQYAGYNQGETYADTGFGKYTEEFIHEIGLMCERPNVLPTLIQKYQPTCAVVGSMGYNWPVVLRREGWRCVFYAPDGSVWLPAGVRPELPAVTEAAVTQSFQSDRATNGLPIKAFIFFRQILALQSMGYENLAFDELLTLPAKWKKSELFWESATKLAFTDPPLSMSHREALDALARQPEHQAVARTYRAASLAADKKWSEVVSTLEPVPRDLPNDAAFTLLATAWEQLGETQKAVDLLRRESLFEFKNGRRYQLLARCEERLGQTAAAAQAWNRALYFYPDDAEIRSQSEAFFANSN